eukprot:GSChrysophyteH2.ASY1.ANO1.1612.1 assembled CDS
MPWRDHSHSQRNAISPHRSCLTCTTHPSLSHTRTPTPLSRLSQVLHGSATHTVKVLTDGTGIVSFDSSELEVQGATVDGKDATVTTSPQHECLGTRLSVAIPENKRTVGSTIAVCFNYKTSTTASAIQWAEAAATADKKHPYVYTQCQAIHARSLLPCQDSPGVKTTYTAEVTAPEWCTVLMSAVATGVTKHKGKSVHNWNQKVPTPAYLIALAAGSLSFRDISDRVRVWSEPSVVQQAADDFSGTEDFVKAAEHFTCPYEWGRYDVLCMPPSFPYGGMENPCLTFVTPTLLTGDKSLADVIMHEIAHSWTGNLVTNQTWNHFFLNEGWTMWLQRKIEQRVKGDDIALFGEDNPLTQLVCPLGEQDPDDSFSSVPYEKGFTLLYYLETLVGHAHFEQFAKHYVNSFKFKTVTSGLFKDCFIAWCKDPKHKLTDAQKKSVDNVDWDDLFHSPGMPKVVHDFSNSLSDASKQLAAKWLAAIAANNYEGKFSAKDFMNFNTQQKLIFLDEILETCEKSAWILPSAKEFLLKQGRMKFTRPLYRLLAASKMGATLAHETFAEHSMIYHPIARKMVKSDLEKASSKGGASSSSSSKRGKACCSMGPVRLTHNFVVGAAVTASFYLLAALK